MDNEDGDLVRPTNTVPTQTSLQRTEQKSVSLKVLIALGSVCL